MDESFFQTLRQIQKKERTNASLARVGPDFYKQVHSYINKLKRSVGNDPFADEHYLLKDSQRIATEICERREHKITDAAVMNIHRSYHLFSKSNPEFDLLDTTPLNLTPEEETLYFSLIDILREHRSKISLDKFGEIKEDDLSIITLETVIINDIYNDLGYIVNDKLLILIEAQTTWSPNILLRSFLYLAKTYQNILTEQAANLYGTTKAQIPTPELFVIFTGDKKNKPDTITLQDEFFNGKASCLDLRIKVIYPSESNDIISQYIQFCQIFTQEVKTNSYSKSTIKQIIEKCKSRNILREYLTEKEKEVRNIMEDLFDQEEILKRALNEKVREGRAEGEAKGNGEDEIYEKEKSATISCRQIREAPDVAQSYCAAGSCEHETE